MLKWRQAGSNKSSIGKARGNSGDLNGGGFGGGGSGSGSGSGRLGDDGNYGLTDYRLIPRWHFVTQPFLEQEDKANMTIGTLYVKVVEARGLMASDLSGRSDPYIRLCLTGRYLSHGQEWSENLRLHQQTKTIKYTLDPVWDEEFTFPVRRAGALLKVEVWDWDRSSPDDPLGHFQVKIGEEMLSQEPMDMWYVLEAPRGMTVSAASAAAKAKRQGNVSTEGRGSEPPQNISTSSDDLADQDDGDELNSSPYSPSEVGSSVAGGEGEKRDFTPGSFKLPKKSLPSIAKRFTITAPAEHSHASAEEASVCVTCIDIRRKMFGEVRLLMWFQFDEFAETCSHLWPEEPLQPEKMHFSPNQLYRKGMLFWEMFLPYLNFMREADAIMCWGRPWRSLGWLIALLGMLLVPLVLIFVVNMALVRIVISAYLKHNHHGVSGGGEGDGSGGRADAIDQSSRHSADLPPLFNDASTHVNLGSGRRISSGNAGATAVAANRRDSVFSAAFSTPPSTPNGVNGRSIHGAGGGGEGIGGSFVPSPGSVRSSVQRYEHMVLSVCLWRGVRA